MIRNSHAEVAMAVEALGRAISSMSVADLPALSGELERLRATTLLRMMTPTQPTGPADAGRNEDDRYLTMQEVKERTGLSLSHLYELGRMGTLKVAAMGRGGRGYRVLMSDLLAWEASLSTESVDIRLSNVLTSRDAGRRVPSSPNAARVDTGANGAQDRRASDHALPMGARRERRTGTRREIDTPPGTEPAA
jgi:hypothetical protein